MDPADRLLRCGHDAGARRRRHAGYACVGVPDEVHRHLGAEPMTEPAPFNSLYTRVKSLIPAAPDALIRQEITYIMMDFTGDTNLFMEEVPLDINTTDIEYPFVLQQGGRPNRLMRVWNTPDDD